MAGYVVGKYGSHDSYRSNLKNRPPSAGYPVFKVYSDAPNTTHNYAWFITEDEADAHAAAMNSKWKRWREQWLS